MSGGIRFNYLSGSCVWGWRTWQLERGITEADHTCVTVLTEPPVQHDPANDCYSSGSSPWPETESAWLVCTHSAQSRFVFFKLWGWMAPYRSRSRRSISQVRGDPHCLGEIISSLLLPRNALINLGRQEWLQEITEIKRNYNKGTVLWFIRGTSVGNTKRTCVCASMFCFLIGPCSEG